MSTLPRTPVLFRPRPRLLGLALATLALAAGQAWAQQGRVVTFRGDAGGGRSSIATIKGDRYSIRSPVVAKKRKGVARPNRGGSRHVRAISGPGKQPPIIRVRRVAIDPPKSEGLISGLDGVDTALAAPLRLAMLDTFETTLVASAAAPPSDFDWSGLTSMEITQGEPDEDAPSSTLPELEAVDDERPLLGAVEPAQAFQPGAVVLDAPAWSAQAPAAAAPVPMPGAPVPPTAAPQPPAAPMIMGGSLGAPPRRR